MKQEEKQQFLQNAKDHVVKVQKSILERLVKIKEMLKVEIERVKRAKGGERMLKMRIIQYNQKRQEELNHLKPSPYFVRCDVEFDKE